MDKLELLEHIINKLIYSFKGADEYDAGYYDALESVLVEIEWLKSINKTEK